MPAPVTASAGFSILNWKPFSKNTLVAFLSVSMPSGLILHGCSYHRKGDSRWIGMPAKSYAKDGATTWTPLVEFASKSVRERFQEEALKAIDRYLGEGGDQ